MNDHTQNGMAEATRLTQQGRLEEATAAIQRAIGGTHFPASSTGGSGVAGPIDVDSWIVREGPRGTGTERRAAHREPGAAMWTTPGPTLLTQGPDDFATGTRMNDLAEEHTFLVAYPAQAGNANMQKCWNWFQAADQQRGRGEPSIIAGITSQVAEEYEVAEGKVYIAGMSAGGAMAAIMGATYPDLYAAVGVHSGLAPGAASDLPSAFTAMRQGGPVVAHENVSGRDREILPTIIFHGDGDTTVHPRNGDRLLAHLSGGRSVSSLRVRTRRGRVQGGHEYTRFTYHDSEGRDLV